jgi:hypothetical protein
MSKYRFVATGLLGLVGLLCGVGGAAAQQPAGPAGVPVRMLVTAEPHSGSSVPVINREDVQVFEQHQRDTVTDWVPAQGDHAALELVIMIDDESNTRLGTQLGDIRQFIDAQPPTTKIGVAYMQNGMALFTQEPTSDHALAAKALRLPMGVGGINSSPYFSLSDLIKRWPASDARHEVMMVTSGVDLYYGIGDLEDPYLEAAIDDAVKAGVIVSAIYSPGEGHLGHSYWLNYWGQIYLSELAEKTGGEAYYIGFTGSPVSFSPYLDDLGHHLEHQYWLSFLAKPQKKSGWQHVRITTEVPNVDLVSAKRVWVAAGR